MGTITLTAPVAATAITAGLLATDFATIQTVINGNLDNANISSSAAIALSKLADPGAGKVVSSAGAGAVAAFPPGYEVVSLTLSSTFGPTTIATASPGTVLTTFAAGTFEAVKHYLDVSIQNARCSSVGASIYFILSEGGVAVAAFPVNQTDFAGSASNGHVFTFRIPFTPTAGSHTYQVAVFGSSGVATYNILAGAQFRIVKA